MGDVIDLAKAREARQKWRTALVMCRGCRRRWVPIWPDGADPTQLECPHCHSSDSEVLDDGSVDAEDGPDPA